MASGVVTVLGILALVLIFLAVKRVSKIFKGKDGKFSPAEFLKMVGAGTLLVLSVYMIIKEANREEAWQLFGPSYVFLVIGGFITIIGLEKVLLTAASIWKKDTKDKTKTKEIIDEDDYEDSSRP